MSPTKRDAINTAPYKKPIASALGLPRYLMIARDIRNVKSKKSVITKKKGSELGRSASI